MRYVIGCGRLFFVGVLILLILFIIYCIFPWMKWRARARIITRLAPWIPAVLGIRVAVRGRVPDAGAASRGYRDAGCGYMVCCNHISFVDIIVLDAILPVHFVAKKEIASWPLFGAITTGVGTIYIDRERRRAVLEVAEAMRATLESGENVLFIPEGTTGPGDALLPFHANLFSAACAAGAEVLPVALRYTRNGETTTIPSYAEVPLFDVMKRIVFTPGIVAEATILEPIDAAAHDRRTVNAMASERMANALGFPDATAALQAEIDSRRKAAQKK